MRQTGRSTRIVDFAVQQLLENCQVIVTDHAAFEFQGTYKKIYANEFADTIKKTNRNSYYGN